jgi:hypothetical protein
MGKGTTMQAIASMSYQRDRQAEIEARVPDERARVGAL